MNTIILYLPPCPSSNALWSTPQHFKRRIRSREYNAWLRTAGWEARRQLVGVLPITGTFSARIEVPMKSSRDRDGWTKATFDLLQRIGAIVNDSGLRDYEVVGAERDDVLVVLTDLGGPEQRAAKVYSKTVRKPRATAAQIKRAHQMGLWKLPR